MRGRWRLIVVVALLVVSIVVGWLLRPRPPLPPLEVSLWYWKQPFEIPDAERSALRSMGIRSLYVRAGTFVQRGEGVALTLPQVWKGTSPDLDITLVFNMGYDLVRPFQSLSNETLASGIVERVERERARGRGAGIRVVGVQLDFDCPTKRLSKYADLLGRLRVLREAGRCKLSITALPTWFNSGFNSSDAAMVMRQVDFTVPQFYEPGMGMKRDTLVPISRLSMLRRGLKQAGATGLPFYAGIPAYGHAMLYDEHGDLDSLYHDLTARDAVQLFAFRTTAAYGIDSKGRPATSDGKNYIGEDVIDLEAVRAASNGQGLGYHLVYELPTPELIAQHLTEVRRDRPANCRGVILFRYPEADSAMTVPLEGIATVLTGKPARPEIEVRLKPTRSKETLSLIDSGDKADSTGIDLAITVTNKGTANTFLAPDTVVIAVCLDKPGFETDAVDTIEQGRDGIASYFVADFERLWNETGKLKADVQTERLNEILSSYRCNPTRANTVLVSLPCIAVGETIRAATLHLPSKHPQRVRAFWRVRSPGGYETSNGAVPWMALE